jgi:hypothetical protein
MKPTEKLPQAVFDLVAVCDTFTSTFDERDGQTCLGPVGDLHRVGAGKQPTKRCPEGNDSGE